MTVIEGTVLITETEVRSSIRRVIDHAESIWDEWAWQVENRTWEVVGYSSWDEMRRAEYGNLTSITAPREERPELVSRFRGAGLTQQQTADTLGVGQKTVSRYDEPRQSHPARSSHMTTSPTVDTTTGEVSDDYVTDQADLNAPHGHTEQMSRDPFSESNRFGEPSRVTSPAPSREPMTESAAQVEQQQQETRALSTALAVLHGLRVDFARARYRASWKAQRFYRGNSEQFYNPETIRQFADGLIDFANELEQDNA